MARIDEREGRRLFGLDATRYERGRPTYPPGLFSILQTEGALFRGCDILEIGPGSGTATRHLAEQAGKLVLVEPDERFRTALESIGPAIRLLTCPFEDALLEPASFDLVLSATAFHWLDPATRVDRIAGPLRPGGHVALLWNLFGDADRFDAFHVATQRLLSQLPSGPSGGPETAPFALDRPAREAEFCSDGRFERVAYAETRWSLSLDPAQVRDLYATFSHIARLDDRDRERLLDDLCRVAAEEFAGRVVRNMTSVVYLFRRTAR